MVISKMNDNNYNLLVETKLVSATRLPWFLLQRAFSYPRLQLSTLPVFLWNTDVFFFHLLQRWFPTLRTGLFAVCYFDSSLVLHGIQTKSYCIIENSWSTLCCSRFVTDTFLRNSTMIDRTWTNEKNGKRFRSMIYFIFIIACGFYKMCMFRKGLICFPLLALMKYDLKSIKG